MVANMDQNGIEYPARHFGTEHYLNNIVGGGVGPWYTNINAIPLYTTPNNLYDATAIQRIQHNLANAQAFRDATAAAVSQAFQVPGPEVQLHACRWRTRCASTRSARRRSTRTRSRFRRTCQATSRSTRRSSTTTPAVPTRCRSSGTGASPATASSAPTTRAPTRQVGGNENPYPVNYASKPTLGQYALYDTNDDTPEHLNYYASGTTHGPGGPSSPSEGLKRALELPATWTSYLIAGDAYGGTEAKSQQPGRVLRDRSGQAVPDVQRHLRRVVLPQRGGSTHGLKYYWDFGDGTTMATTNPTVTHDVRLDAELVRREARGQGRRQVGLLPPGTRRFGSCRRTSRTPRWRTSRLLRPPTRVARSLPMSRPPSPSRPITSWPASAPAPRRWSPRSAERLVAASSGDLHARCVSQRHCAWRSPGGRGR